MNTLNQCYSVFGEEVRASFLLDLLWAICGKVSSRRSAPKPHTNSVLHRQEMEVSFSLVVGLFMWHCENLGSPGKIQNNLLDKLLGVIQAFSAL